MGFVKRIIEDDKDPIESFINNLQKGDAEKLLRQIEKLDKYGLALGAPYIKQLQNYDLWEFRVQYNRNQHRIIFFIFNQKLILLHGFTYKDSIPPNELELAKARKESLLKNISGKEHQ